MKITREKLARLIRETVEHEIKSYTYDHTDLVPEEILSIDYPKALSFSLNGEEKTVIIVSKDDMDDVLDLLQALDIPYSVD